jgi:hypothetical protein
MDECKPLAGGAGGGGQPPDRAAAVRRPPGRGLLSFTYQLNLSAVYGMGAARRGCASRVKGVFGGV